MNKRPNIVLLFALIFFFSFRSQAQKSHYTVVRSVTEINGSLPDTCSISAYVTDIYVCPPCPPPMQCKPCIGDHITISDVASKPQRSLTVLTDNPKEFKIGKKYTILIRLYKNGKGEVFETVLVKNKK